MRMFRHDMDLVGIAAQAKLTGLMDERAHIPHLSPREIECLTWAAVSKTNTEIALILGGTLTANTVNSYIQSAAKKLQVRGKIHAAVKATQLKIIFPI
ncbi:MAG: helix-turn-helix transcriptional regulator [Kordiimonadaceae bacterium]|nr:helix-turn-helix transcriptional regulator [Kordiimonadaceae bacterium]